MTERRATKKAVAKKKALSIKQLKAIAVSKKQLKAMAKVAQEQFDNRTDSEGRLLKTIIRRRKRLESIANRLESDQLLDDRDAKYLGGAICEIKELLSAEKNQSLDLLSTGTLALLTKHSNWLRGMEHEWSVQQGGLSEGHPGAPVTTDDIGQFAFDLRNQTPPIKWTAIPQKWIDQNPGDDRFKDLSPEKKIERFRGAKRRYEDRMKKGGGNH